MSTEIGNIFKEVGIPGGSLAIIDDAKVVYSNSYGYKSADSRRKVNRNTLFEACSVSKTFLVFIAHKLVDEGKLDLDKPMYQYLEYTALQHDSTYKLITPRMILNHTSGIENWQANNNPNLLEIVSPPGKIQGYSGEAYHYLTRVIEKIRGISYEAFFKKEVIQPVHLTRTYTSYDRKRVLIKKMTFPLNYAYGHSKLQKKKSKERSLNPLPAAGIEVTARDYAKFFLFVFGNSLSKTSIKNILSRSTTLAKADSSYYYGLGYEVIANESDTIVFHTGSNSGYKAFVCYSLVKKKGLVLFTNSDLGIMAAKALCEKTTQLNLDSYFNKSLLPQYPNEAFSLLRLYSLKGAEAMFQKIEESNRLGQKRVSMDGLVGLAVVLSSESVQICRQLLNISIDLYPESPEPYYILGQLDSSEKKYPNALRNYNRAKELHINQIDIDECIEKCRSDIKTF